MELRINRVRIKHSQPVIRISTNKSITFLSSFKVFICASSYNNNYLKEFQRLNSHTEVEGWTLRIPVGYEWEFLTTFKRCFIAKITILILRCSDAIRSSYLHLTEFESFRLQINVQGFIRGNVCFCNAEETLTI